MLYQQGDILFFKVSDFEGIEKKEIKTKNGYKVIAEGEASGHYHKVKADYAELYQEKNDPECMLLELLKKSKVEHEEHDFIDLPKGKYIVRRVQEFNHFENEARAVED